MYPRSCRLRRSLKRVAKIPLTGLIALFGHLFAFPHHLAQNRRKRIFTTWRTFWLFLYQTFALDCSCRSIVLHVNTFFFINEKRLPSLNTAAYCKARKRFPLSILMDIFHTLEKHSRQEFPDFGSWFGRRVLVVDGTTINMPDTKENQRVYPQTKAQKPGCGFPLVKIAALFSLSTGCLMNWKAGPYRESERSLFRKLFGLLEKGDVLLGDRGVGSFMDFFFFLQRGLDFVIRGNEKNRRSSKVKRRLGKGDHIVEWVRSPVRPAWVDMNTWREAPRRILLREITYIIDIPGYRSKKITVVTSLLDKKLFPARAFKELYLKRWRVELFFRDIKTTMGMEMLTCLTPGMVEKEIVLHFIAYNLVRMIIAASSKRHGVSVERISFKGTLQYLEILNGMGMLAIIDENIEEWCLRTISQMKIPERPGRREPRAVKRRPKRFQLLTEHRSVFKEDPHRGRKSASLS